MKHILAVFALFLIPYSLFLKVLPIYAQSDWSGDCVGPNEESANVATIQGATCLIGNVLTVALQLIGLVMFIMLLIGGLRYLTSGGDPKAVEAAQGTITSGLVGLILAILAWFILVFIKQITGVDVTQFAFPSL